MRGAGELEHEGEGERSDEPGGREEGEGEGESGGQKWATPEVGQGGEGGRAAGRTMEQDLEPKNYEESVVTIVRRIPAEPGVRREAFACRAREVEREPDATSHISRLCLSVMPQRAAHCPDICDRMPLCHTPSFMRRQSTPAYSLTF